MFILKQSVCLTNDIIQIENNYAYRFFSFVLPLRHSEMPIGLSGCCLKDKIMPFPRAVYYFKVIHMEVPKAPYTPLTLFLPPLLLPSFYLCSQKT